MLFILSQILTKSTHDLYLCVHMETSIVGVGKCMRYNVMYLIISKVNCSCVY